MPFDVYQTCSFKVQKSKKKEKETKALVVAYANKHLHCPKKIVRSDNWPESIIIVFFSKFLV